MPSTGDSPTALVTAGTEAAVPALPTLERAGEWIQEFPAPVGETEAKALPRAVGGGSGSGSSSVAAGGTR